MRRESVISVGLAVAGHAVVLFGVPATLLRPALKAPEPAYMEVSLLPAPPALPAGEVESQVLQPAPAPIPKPNAEPPPEVEAEPQRPDAINVPPEPEALKMPEPTAPDPQPAPTEPAHQVATASAPDSATTSSATQSRPAAGVGVVTNQASGTEYQLLSQPYYTKRGQARYPREAKKLRQEGTVVLTLYINALGRLDKIEVKQSSGFPLLDEAAIAAERQSRFRPAYLGNRPVASKAEVPYRFQLERD
jgi:periplasmic protein TonB